MSKEADEIKRVWKHFEDVSEGKNIYINEDEKPVEKTFRDFLKETSDKKKISKTKK